MNIEAAGGWKSSETVLKEKAYAKINLSLDILSRREDGYHNLRMVMQSVTLCDTLEMSRADGILFFCDKAELPAGPGNTVYRAAELFCRETGVPGVKIHLQKRIPSQAGLGGGSEEAAGVRRGMNRLYGTDLPEEKLRRLGQFVGADVPFCVRNGLCLAEGTGELLTTLEKLPACRILICKPEIGISTGEAFRRADVEGRPHNHYTERVLEALSSGSLSAFGKALGNDFQTVMQISEVETIREHMLEAGAYGAVMTGSGSAVFGIFPSEGEKASLCAAELKRQFEETFLCEPIYP